jgi:outer membrane protein W
MKKSLLLVLAFTLALAGSAMAAGMTLGVNGGMAKFTGDAGEGLKTGMIFGATGDYMVNDMWAVGGSVSYLMTKHEDDGKNAEDVYPGGGLTGEIESKFNVIPIGVHAKFFPPMKDSPIAPYLLAGAGMYMSKYEWSAGDYSEEGDESDFGFRGGAGATYAVNEQVGINVEADFHSIMTEDESTNVFTVRAGVMFKLGAK